MRKLLFGAVVAALSAFAIAGCNTPTGTGAAAGAATGAVVGGPVGAVVGAGAGALIGASVSNAEARKYGPVPQGGYPLARPAGGGMFQSPYSGRMYDLRAVPSGGLVRDQDTGKLFRKP